MVYSAMVKLMNEFRRISLTALSLLIFCPVLLATENIDPQNTDRQYAWSENGGWINAEPGGQGGPGAQVVEDGEADGWLWSENFGWISLNCSNTSSCGDVDYKVSASEIEGQPGKFAFSGWAWGENIGWISFSCENTTSCEKIPFGVTATDGDVAGLAWGENIGWISFNCSDTESCDGVDFGVSYGELLNEIFKDGFET